MEARRGALFLDENGDSNPISTVLECLPAKMTLLSSITDRRACLSRANDISCQPTPAFDMCRAKGILRRISQHGACMEKGAESDR